MFIQINETLSIPVKEIVMIMDKDCYNEIDKKIITNIEVINYNNEDDNDVKAYIITNGTAKDKGNSYKMYKSTKSSLSLLNKYDKLEGTNG